MATVKRQTPEKAVQRAVVRALRDLGFYVADLTQPRRTMMPVGLPDLYARHPRWGLRLWIEVKAGRNKPTPEQFAWAESERECGGHAVTVWSLDDLLRELRALGAPIT